MTFDAVIGIDLAKTIAEAQKAATPLVAPMQNIVMADDGGDTGHIGLMLPGRVPLRSTTERDLPGLVPEPRLGRALRLDQGEAYPVACDGHSHQSAASGRIATANNKPVPDGLSLHADTRVGIQLSLCTGYAEAVGGYIDPKFDQRILPKFRQT